MGFIIGYDLSQVETLDEAPSYGCRSGWGISQGGRHCQLAEALIIYGIGGKQARFLFDNHGHLN
jgi:hypothetical protein